VSGAPRVVVGVPVRDSAHFLPETLATIAAQDHPRLEVVISDDASRDGTVDVCRDFAARDARFRVVVHREPRGWIGNYNSLLAHASGDYFCWMPHDDLYDPGYVRTLVALLEARPDAVVAHAAGTLVDGAGRPLGPVPSARALDGTRSRLARALRHVWSTERAKGRAFRGVFRTAALRATRGLRPVHFAADSLLMFELSLRGPFAYDPRPSTGSAAIPGACRPITGTRSGSGSVSRRALRRRPRRRSLAPGADASPGRRPRSAGALRPCPPARHRAAGGIRITLTARRAGGRAASASPAAA
jgi:hypothetical protein